MTIYVYHKGSDSQRTDYKTTNGIVHTFIWNIPYRSVGYNEILMLEYIYIYLPIIVVLTKRKETNK